MTGLRFVSLVIAVWFLTINAWCRAGVSNSLLDVSADRTLIACSNRDNGTVTVIDRARRQVLHEIPVGSKPEAVSYTHLTLPTILLV